MHIEFATTRDRHYVRHVVHRSTARQRWFSHLAGILIVAYGLPGTTVAGLVGVLNVGVVLLGGLIALLPLTIARQIVSRTPEQHFGPHHYLLTDDSFQVSTATGRLEWHWVEFTGLTETRQALVLRRGPYAGSDVPKKALTGEQLAELRALLGGLATRGGSTVESGSASPSKTGEPASAGPPATGIRSPVPGRE